MRETNFLPSRNNDILAKALQLDPEPSQLSSNRVQSSIKRSSDDYWTYPSAKQFHMAIKRKGHKVNENDVENIVTMHNMVNEQCWTKIVALEGTDKIQLERFEGRPHDLSFGAMWRMWWDGAVKPFDRHDWYIRRNDGVIVKYLIDFYKGKEGESVFLDVRRS